jgi:hypothetical protein
MRYRRTKYKDKNKVLKELGCKYPESTAFYSYNATSNIRYQPCVNLYSSLKKSVTKYASVQHFSVTKVCQEAKEVLCVRYVPNISDIIITKHFVGECPLCNYHSEKEYLEDSPHNY